MKEVKWILYTLYIMFYTSLFWSISTWSKEFPIDPNEYSILVAIFAFWSVFHYLMLLFYLPHLLKKYNCLPGLTKLLIND